MFTAFISHIFTLQRSKVFVYPFNVYPDGKHLGLFIILCFALRATQAFGSEAQVVQTPSGLSLFELVETESLGDECPEGSSEPERPRDERLKSPQIL